MKEEIFISTMGIFLIFNIFVALVNPTMVSVLNMDLTGMIVTAITIILAGSITVFGSGLSESAIKIVFSAMIIFSVLFQVNIFGFNLGIGLASTMINVFNDGDVLGIGTLIGGALSFLAFFCGMLMVSDSG